MIFAGLAAMALASSQQTEIKVWDAKNYSSKVTQCDILISHPDDPNKIGPGTSQKKANLPAAIAACEKAVKADPENPRLNYQLARAYGYSGMGEKAYKYRDKAVAAGYPQSLFVIGYITLMGENKQPQDTCKGGDLIRRSAKVNRFAGQVAFPYYWLNGKLAQCNFDVTEQELLGYVEAGRKTAAGDYYKETLLDLLERDIRARFKTN